MKLLFQILLLVVMFTLQKSQEAEIESTTYPEYDVYTYTEYLDPEYGSVENNAVFNITVYRQMEDREPDRVIVVCVFDRMFDWPYTRWIKPFELSVESELNYTKDKVDCTSSDNRTTCVYMVTVSPPASFTCEHEVHSNGEVKNISTQTYTYNRPVLDHHEEGVSLFYICFSSFLAVGLFIMTVAVIVTTIRSKAKDSINPTTDTDNDYMDA